MTFVAIFSGLFVALLLKLTLRRRGNRRMASTPLGGMGGEFFSPYRMPGRRLRRSGKGF